MPYEDDITRKFDEDEAEIDELARTVANARAELRQVREVQLAGDFPDLSNLAAALGVTLSDTIYVPCERCGIACDADVLKENATTFCVQCDWQERDELAAYVLLTQRTEAP